MNAVLPVLLAGLLVSACATTGTTHPLTRRASFDLGCAKKKLRYVEIDERSYGVVGCNKRATYVESCDGEGWGKKCTWILNGVVESKRPARRPAASDDSGEDENSESE